MVKESIAGTGDVLSRAMLQDATETVKDEHADETGVPRQS
jgi:hypothetical protein